MRPDGAGPPGRLPSMEMEREPKALSLHELNYAREAALYVLRTHSSQDAARIFTQGLKPVLAVRKSSTADSEDDDGGHGDGDLFNPDAFRDDGSSSCHRYGRAAVEGRDVATAPF